MPRVVRRHPDPEDDGEAAPVEAEHAVAPPAPLPQRRTVTGRTLEPARGPPKLEPRRLTHHLFGDAGGLWGLPCPGLPKRGFLKEAETVNEETVSR